MSQTTALQQVKLVWLARIVYMFPNNWTSHLKFTGCGMPMQLVDWNQDTDIPLAFCTFSLNGEWNKGKMFHSAYYSVNSFSKKGKLRCISSQLAIAGSPSCAEAVTNCSSIALPQLLLLFSLTNHWYQSEDKHDVVGSKILSIVAMYTWPMWLLQSLKFSLQLHVYRQACSMTDNDWYGEGVGSKLHVS